MYIEIADEPSCSCIEDPKKLCDHPYGTSYTDFTFSDFKGEFVDEGYISVNNFGVDFIKNTIVDSYKSRTNGIIGLGDIFTYKWLYSEAPIEVNIGFDIEGLNHLQITICYSGFEKSLDEYTDYDNSDADFYRIESTNDIHVNYGFIGRAGGGLNNLGNLLENTRISSEKLIDSYIDKMILCKKNSRKYF